MQELELEKEFELEEGDELLQNNPVDVVVEVLDVESTEVMVERMGGKESFHLGLSRSRKLT